MRKHPVEASLHKNLLSKRVKTLIGDPPYVNQWSMLSEAYSLQEFNEDIGWLLKYRKELVAKHEDEWVAVLKATIIDHDKSLEALVNRLKTKGYKPENMLIEFLSREPIEAIL